MAVVGLLLRPPPCFIFIATSFPSPSSSRQRTRSLMLSHSMTISFVSGGSYHRHHMESKRRSRGTGVYASLFGVGASEALVIGVVALLFFGPKVAEVARNLGKTLRAFQPTIRELQDVSREFKSTLGQEIGLDEVPPSTNYRSTTMNNSQQPAINTSSDDKPEVVPCTSEELMKVTEEQLSASAAAAWNTQEPPPS
uniref:Sec-independent protein translocase protein TATB, chloroplastic n=1 Tax=Oryza brachyantha TaxID=4533 RepID=J3MAH1_ORYBR